MWIGTDDGLNRYDGSNVTIFKTSESNEAQLKGSWIQNIAEDINGNILLATDRGLSVFDYKFERFRDLDVEPLPQAVNYQNIDQVFVDSKGQIWVAVEEDGLYVFTPENEQFFYDSGLEGTFSISNSRIKQIFEDSNGGIWLVTYDGIEYKPDHSISFEHIHDQEFIEGIAEDTEGFLYVITYSGELLKSITSSSPSAGFKEVNISNFFPSEGDHAFQSIHIDANGVLFIGVENEGVLSLSPDLKHHKLYDQSNSDPNSLSSNSISLIMNDSFGDLWVGTRYGGINIVHYKKLAFKHYDLSYPVIFEIGEDSVSGKVFVSTDGGGLCLFDPEKGEYEVLDKLSSGLSANDVTALAFTKKEIVVGTWNGGINFLPKGSTRFRQSFMGSKSINNVFDMVPDGSGNLWIVPFRGGLEKLNLSTMEFSNIMDEPGVPDDLELEVVEVDSSGNLYFGGYRGLHTYSLRSNNFKTFTANNTDTPTRISNDIIHAIEVESDSIIWIGSRYGLNRFNTLTENFESFYEEDGLPSNTIKSILIDDQGLLWLGTNNGISRFDYHNKIFTNFNLEDGIQGRQFNRNSSLKASDGRLYFGSTDGLTVFNPDLYYEEGYEHKIAFTDLFINNEKVVADEEGSPLTKHIDREEKLVFDYSQDFFTLKFTSLNYSTPYNNQYKYILEGFDPSWTVSATGAANYTNVRAGEYTFRVVGTTDANTWSANDRSITIVILPPWWETWWFRLTVVLFASFCIWFVFRMRVKALERQSSLLKQKVAQRTRNLNATVSNLKKTQMKLIQSEKMASVSTLMAGMAHEINNPLNFIQGGKDLITREIEKGNGQDKGLINSSLDHIQEGILRTSKVVRSLELFSAKNQEYETCDINQLLEDTITLISNNIQGQYTIQKEFQNSLPPIQGIVKELEALFINILNNAIDALQSSGGLILLKTASDAKDVIVTIDDDGVGMSPETQKSILEPFFTTKVGVGTLGLGVTISHAIVDKHNGEISFDSSLDQGTTVIIKLPFEAAVSA